MGWARPHEARHIEVSTCHAHNAHIYDLIGSAHDSEGLRNQGEGQRTAPVKTLNSHTKLP